MYTKLDKTVAIHHKYAKGCREAQQGPVRLCPSWEKALSPSHFTLQINFPNFKGQKPKQTMSEGKHSRNPFLGLCLLYVRVIETGWEEPSLAKESCQPRWQTSRLWQCFGPGHLGLSWSEDEFKPCGSEFWGALSCLSVGQAGFWLQLAHSAKTC